MNRTSFDPGKQNDLFLCVAVIYMNADDEFSFTLKPFVYVCDI